VPHTLVANYAFHNVAGLILTTLACLFLWCNGANAAEPAQVDYHAYPLQYVSAEEVEAALAALLPGEGQVVADRRGNRVLVCGSAQSCRIAQRVIRSMDRAESGAAARAAEPVFEAYRFPAGQAAAIAAQLKGEFPPTAAVRIVVDQRTSQILVRAPPEIQRQIADRLNQALPTPAASHKPSLVRSASPSTQSHEVQLRQTTARQLQTALVGMLGERLLVVGEAGGDTTGYRLKLPDGRTAQLTIDRQTDRVLVQGDGPVVDSCVRMVRALDRPREPGDNGTRLISLTGAKPAHVRRAVDAIQNGQAAPESQSGDQPADGEQSNRAVAASPEEPEATPGNQLPAAAANDRSTRPPVPKTQQTPGPPAEGEEPKGKLLDDRKLIGPVQIEMLDGLDVMVIRGHRRDVEQVVDIIERIEQLGAETEPAIEVHALRHVDCDALATLINQLYADVFAPRQGDVSITALVKPNALLLIGRRENVETVINLVKRLDQPVAPETQFRVFRLEHASAVTAQATVQEFFADRGALGTKVLVTADFRSNSLILQAGPRDMAEAAALIQRLDTPTSKAVNEIRLFKLENSLAEELAPILQEAINGQAVAGRPGAARPSAQQQQAAGRQQIEEKSAMLRFITVDGTGRRRLNSGILTDVRITADTRANTLLVSAPSDSMELIAALIRQLDQLPGVQAQIKVFGIVNGDAASLAEVLETLFGRQTREDQPVVQTAAGEGESSLVPLRFAVDLRTNTIIASGSQGDLTVVEAILLRLDDSDVRQRKCAIYRLRNAPAVDVANAINEYLRSERQVQQITPELLSPFEQIEREVVVVPEPVSNSLIVSATPRFFEEVCELVERLDERPPMVMIQVLIAEVALGNTDEFGVELGLQDSVLFDRSILGDIVTTTQTTYDSSGNPASQNESIVAATNVPGFNFNNQPLGNSGATNAMQTAGALAGQALSTFALGRVNSELQYGGLVLSASSESVNILIRALQECGRLDVLSRPQIMTLDNQPAFIQVGQRVPRITGTQINETGQVNNITLENVGLILGVTPRISPDGLVVMEIDAEKSALGPEKEGIPISIAPTGDVIRSPRIDTTTAQTTVSAMTGQTLIFGGLITKSRSTTNRRVPVLAEIPVVGNLFRYDNETFKRTELLIIMTPHIVSGEAEAEAIKRVETARINWCLSDVLEMHGDGGFRGRSDEWADEETNVIYPDEPHKVEIIPKPEAVERIPKMSPADQGSPFILEPLPEEPAEQGSTSNSRPGSRPGSRSGRILKQRRAADGPERSPVNRADYQSRSENRPRRSTSGLQYPEAPLPGDLSSGQVIGTSEPVGP